MEIEINIKGELNELSPVLAAILALSSNQPAASPEAAPILEASHEEMQDETPEEPAVQDEVVEPSTRNNGVTQKVFDYIVSNPGCTVNVIVEKTGYTKRQVWGATGSLTKSNRVAVLSTVFNGRETAHRFIEFGASLQGRASFTQAMREFVRKNPGLTSYEIAMRVGAPYPNVTSIMSNLLRSQTIRPEGRGQASDPFRYYTNEANQSAETESEMAVSELGHA